MGFSLNIEHIKATYEGFCNIRFKITLRAPQNFVFILNSRFNEKKNWLLEKMVQGVTIIHNFSDNFYS